MKSDSPSPRACVLAAILLVALMSLGSAPASARQASLELEAAVGVFSCDDTLEVSLMIDSVSDLRGFHVEIGFDPAVIRAFEVLPGAMVDAAGCDAFLQWLNPIPGAAQVIVDVGILGCSISGSGELLRVRFTGVEIGTSPLTVDAALLRNSLNQALDYIPAGDLVEYVCPGELTFVPPDGVIDCLEVLVVELHIDENVQDLRGSSLVIGYDENVVDPITLRAGSLVSGAGCSYYVYWLNVTTASGTIEVDVANLGCSIDGPGPILEIEFQGVAEGISPLDCISLDLRDSANQLISAECVPATLEHRCAVGVREGETGRLPVTSVLHPSFPNPFNPRTTISFTLAQPGRVQLSIYSTDGRKIATLLDEERTVGLHQVQWGGRDQQGGRVSSGTYLVQLVAPDKIESQRITLLK